MGACEGQGAPHGAAVLGRSPGRRHDAWRPGREAADGVRKTNVPNDQLTDVSTLTAAFHRRCTDAGMHFLVKRGRMLGLQGHSNQDHALEEALIHRRVSRAHSARPRSSASTSASSLK
mmetsp:Transcript_10583/g.33329  ORF Transcript_10583/g.33329 Transcript_10583/m.33329 type:complete len:118 (+) Transcript_10583:47-400(+)